MGALQVYNDNDNDDEYAIEVQLINLMTAFLVSLIII